MPRKRKRAPIPTQANFDEIYQTYKAKSLNLCRRVCKDGAEDAHQDAWLKIYSKLPSFRGDCALSSWIFRVTLNACLMQIRKEKKLLTRIDPLKEQVGNPADMERKGDIAEAMDLFPSNELPLERVLIGRQRLNRLFSLIKEKLPLNLNTCALVWQKELTNEEASAILKETIPAIKSKRYRAKTLALNDEDFCRAY